MAYYNVYKNKKLKWINMKKQRVHCVHLPAYTSFSISVENTREYIQIRSELLERVVQMEIGVLFVEKIHNFRKGDALYE